MQDELLWNIYPDSILNNCPFFLLFGCIKSFTVAEIYRSYEGIKYNIYNNNAAYKSDCIEEENTYKY